MTKRERITLRAKEILAACPEGIRWSELVGRLHEAFPDERHGTITGSAYNFARSDEIYRPAKGVLRLTRFRKGGPSQVLEPPKETGTCLKENPVMSSAVNMREQLERYAKTVKERWETCSDNEAATGASLILPLFTILGYDVADPRECKPQYKADFGKGRTKQPVDWAFCVNDWLAFLVEAKAAGKKIDRHEGQLRDYYAKAQPDVKLGILTTGVQWRFFTDLLAEHVMDKEPFLAWDVLNDTIPYEFLTILQRAEFKPELIKAFAKRKRRQSVLVAELTRLLEPSDEFVKLAIQNKEMLLENRNLNAKVIAEWKPILASAIQEWAQERRLTEALGRGAIDTKDEGQQAPDEPGGTERPSREGRYREFWDPIRSEPNGLFAGKPVGGSWITKGFRGLALDLIVRNHASYVDLYFHKEDRAKRRDNAVKLFPAAEYDYTTRDTDKAAVIRFPVLDKGIKDREHWPEIRKRLTALGGDIFHKISNSDV